MLLRKELSAPDSRKITSQPGIEISKKHETDTAHPRSDVIGTLIANLERWLPRDLGNAYVMVNVPDYTLSVTQSGKLIWRTSWSANLAIWQRR